MEPTAVLAKLAAQGVLTRPEARELFDAIMDGGVAPALLADLLRALAARGEQVSEIVGAAEAMRARATPVRLPPGVAAIDTCSTGGDGWPTFNISTTVAIVAAAAGATVAKHGNRSNVRPSGSAEALAALGINVEADVPVLEHCLRECRIAFLYAPRLHPAMRYAAPVRKALGIRTIFNIVGPLTNPAGVRRQLVGVSRPDLVHPVLSALQELGAERAMVVHGLGGVCDLRTDAPNVVAQWDGRAATSAQVEGRVAGAKPAPLEELCVSSPQQSAALVECVLAGEPGAAREIVILNTAAALWVAGLAPDWLDGARQAREAIDDGSAQATLARWREMAGSPITP